MNKYLLISGLIFSFLICVNDLDAQKKKKDKKNEITTYSQRSVNDSINGIYIPKNLEDCFREIDLAWDEKNRNEIKSMTEEQFLGNSHFGMGMWIRNNWGLWGGSRLALYFNDLGIFHPDDMSGIILTSYYRKLKGYDIELNEQIKYYKNYWKKNQE